MGSVSWEETVYLWSFSALSLVQGYILHMQQGGGSIILMDKVL